MDEQRAAKLAQIAAIHDKWVADHLSSASFSPESRPDSKDYNIWYLDMDNDAEDDFQKQAQAVFHPDDEPEEF